MIVNIVNINENWLRDIALVLLVIWIIITLIKVGYNLLATRYMD